MGATSGIGYEVAIILARRGWRIGVAGRREDILAKMSDEIDGVVAYEVIDVNTPEAVDGLHKLIGKLGGMDLYFHSSGIGYQNTALDADKELTTIETNCLGMARLVGEAFRYFEQHPETDGQIAVISSIARTKGLGAAPAYSASKRFTSHYLECLCQLTSIRNIRNIHLTDISCAEGDTVLGGATPIAAIRDVYAYIGEEMQLKDYTALGDNGNHTHIQVNDVNNKEYHGLD